jgi:hypothetical protein
MEDQQIVVEAAMFRLRSGTGRAQFLAASSAAGEVLRGMRGFLGRDLLEGDDGEWLDLLHWASQEDAQRSIEALTQSRDAQPFLELIDPESVQLRHYRTVGGGQ